MKYIYTLILALLTACMNSGKQGEIYAPKKEIHESNSAPSVLNLDIDIDSSLIETFSLQDSYHGYSVDRESSRTCYHMITMPRIVCSIVYKNTDKKSNASLHKILSDTTVCRKYLYYKVSNELDSVELLLKKKHIFPQKSLLTFDENSSVSFLYTIIYKPGYTLDDTDKFTTMVNNILYIKLTPNKGNLIYKNTLVSELIINKNKDYSITRILNNDAP